MSHFTLFEQAAPSLHSLTSSIMWREGNSHSIQIMAIFCWSSFPSIALSAGDLLYKSIRGKNLFDVFQPKPAKCSPLSSVLPNIVVEPIHCIHVLPFWMMTDRKDPERTGKAILPQSAKMPHSLAPRSKKQSTQTKEKPGFSSILCSAQIYRSREEERLWVTIFAVSKRLDLLKTVCCERILLHYYIVLLLYFVYWLYQLCQTVWVII